MTVHELEGGLVGLGRLPQPNDPRDRLHLMAARLATAPPSTRPYRYWSAGKVLDQGASPHCVGFACAQWMQTSPVRQPRAFDGNVAGHGIYDACKLIDGIPDLEGTYVRSGLKVLSDQQRVKEYVWAERIDDVREWLLERGPVIVGTPWYQGMFRPTASGRLEATGEVAGGHAWLVIGVHPSLRLYRMINSWGSWWGDQGRAWIHEETLEALISQGEAVAADEKVPPA